MLTAALCQELTYGTAANSAKIPSLVDANEQRGFKATHQDGMARKKYLTTTFYGRVSLATGVALARRGSLPGGLPS
jgi:hypothetical protein